MSILDVFPEYAATSHLDILRQSEYGFLDEQDHVYLDYTGSGLAARAQHCAHAQRQATAVLGNPHSVSPTSALATELVEQTRARVLHHFAADPAEYAVVFTANATGAARLVGEAYAWQEPGAKRRLVLTADNHNSVNGLREFARRAGVPTTYVPSRPYDLHVDTPVLLQALGDAEPEAAPLESTQPPVSRKSNRRRWKTMLRRALCGFLDDKGGAEGKSEEKGGTTPAAAVHEHSQRRGLFAYPAQSNFSGVRHPLAWIAAAQARGYDVLLDAAAYLPTTQLDLSTYHPDFVLVSWYKLFGYPTGVGCLVARRAALARLRRPWFAGGTIRAVSVGLDWHVPAPRLEAQFEDGTVNFQSIPDVRAGLDWLVGEVGLTAVQTRVRCLTAWFLSRLLALRHTNTPGAPRMVVLYGPDHCALNNHNRGGTVTFNFVDPTGTLVDDRIVAAAAAEARISLRTGCFCNPGAGEIALGLSLPVLRELQRLVMHSAPREDEKGPGQRGSVQTCVGSIASEERRSQTGSQTGSQTALSGESPQLATSGPQADTKTDNWPIAGAVRVSFGVASNTADVERFFSFAEQFRDRMADNSGLGPRVDC